MSKHRPSQAIKAIIIIAVFYTFVLICYPLTNGKTKRLPQLYMIALRFVIIDLGFYWMYQDWEWTEHVVFIHTLAGIGEALERARLAVTAQNGHGV